MNNNKLIENKSGLSTQFAYFDLKNYAVWKEKYLLLKFCTFMVLKLQILFW